MSTSQRAQSAGRPLSDATSSPPSASRDGGAAPPPSWRRWRPGAAVTVIVLALLTGAAGRWVADGLTRHCPALPVSLVRLEVTFSPARFAALLNAENGCRADVIRSFWTDVVFALLYPLFLCAAYRWAERWRRFDVDDEPFRDDVVTRRRRFFVVAPLVAGLLDIFAENLPLWLAARALPPAMPTPAQLDAVWWPVVVGSAGAAVKWALVALSVGAIVVELLSGPRGAVLRRLRFSALAVAFGALPLLVVPQGQDILQRLVEGAWPEPWVVLGGIAAIATAASAVWYCGRKILQLQLEDPAEHRARTEAGLSYRAWAARELSVRERHDRRWYGYFAEQLPRILGIAVLVVSGLAFAVAGLALPWFLAIGVGGLVLVLLLRRFDWSRARVQALGRLVARLFRSPLADPGYLERIGATAVAVVITAVGLLAVRPDGDAADAAAERALFALRLAAALTIGVAWYFYLHVYYRRRRASARADAVGPQRAALARRIGEEATYDAIPLDAIGRPLTVAFVAGLVLSAACLAVFTKWPVPVGRFIGALWVLAIATTNAVFLGTATVWVHARYRVPLVRLLVGLGFLCSLWNDNHPVRTLAPPAGTSVDARPTLAAWFERWSGAADPAGARPIAAPGAPTPLPPAPRPVVLVAAAGGGLRAAYWAAAALAAIQDTAPAFARHVFAISGVSGGSLGAALFTAIHRDAAAGVPLRCARPASADVPPGVSARGPHTACVRRFMADDFLSPVLAKIVAPDAFQRLLPFPVAAFDRSTALEGSWRASYADGVGRATLDSGVMALARDPATGPTLPLLLLNATHVETGKRYVAAAVRGDSALHDAGDVLGLLDRDLSLAAAAHNSARFTYVSPAGRLDRGDGVELGRVVDGGYFENSGLATLREVYEAVRRSDSARGGPARRIMVLYLCNDPLPCARERAADSLARAGRAGRPVGATAQAATYTATRSTWANELLAPARAVLHARDARGALARAQLRAALGGDFVQLNVCDLLRPAASDTATAATDSSRLQRRGRERVVSPPLGWLLSRLARDWMDRSLAPPPGGPARGCPQQNAAEIGRLAALLGGAAVSVAP